MGQGERLRDLSLRIAVGSGAVRLDAMIGASATTQRLNVARRFLCSTKYATPRPGYVTSDSFVSRLRPRQ